MIVRCSTGPSCTAILVTRGGLTEAEWLATGWTFIHDRGDRFDGQLRVTYWCPRCADLAADDCPPHGIPRPDLQESP